MARLRIDPEEVANFVAYLEAFNRDLQDRTSQMHAEFERQSDNWNDAKYEQFAEEFNRCAKLIAGFTTSTKQSTIPGMRNAVERARAYLR